MDVIGGATLAALVGVSVVLLLSVWLQKQQTVLKK